jgi:hypothetical protein
MPNKYTQEILEMAEKGYKEALPSYIDATLGIEGDGLANFIVIELTEYTENAKDRKDAIMKAHDCIVMTIVQLRKVLGAIE